MKKICVIGDSHAGAMKLGWDEIRSEYYDIDFAFLAVPGVGILNLTNNASVLTLKTNDLRERAKKKLSGLETVDVNEFDVILCTGMTSLIHLFILYQREHLLSGQDAHTRTPRYVSEDAYLDGWLENFEKSPLRHVFDVLGNAKASNVYVSFKPLTSAGITKKGNKLAITYNRLGENKKDRDRLWEILHRGIDAILPNWATYCPQPAETVLNELLTKTEYSVRSTRLLYPDNEHDKDDYTHMNASFGVAYIRNFLKQIAA